MNKKHIWSIIIFISIVLFAALIAVMCYYFFSPCEHQWINATCTEPSTCSICGETAGEPIGHKWKDANCTEPKTCILCGETEGEPLGHNWVDATYDDPITCSICGETDGEPLKKPQNSNAYYETTKTNTQPSTTTQKPSCMICGRSVDRSDTFYCELHDCSQIGCPYPAKCSCGTYSSLCEFHACQYPDCLNAPIGGIHYCGAHNT